MLANLPDAVASGQAFARKLAPTKGISPLRAPKAAARRRRSCPPPAPPRRNNGLNAVLKRMRDLIAI
ncbi:hypothetical protein N7414_22995 [Pseudomonas sp. GD04087]|uniref:hypothetical protein n=1 Tax=unclassified Pseudomonas TaxID=196821 RepID=UPI002449F82E|nr:MULTISPECIES: hypothetical protein [unclassified Pseudomonas]MDH0292003.1 hypothetical protein [Pseudomonas sp. GD04087]MDH1052851.1 hypothetical protein [Pseudomonas sp. GD03903]MDH2002014.1 hypothetical protein [Pseudomonas sp. GD03691]